LSIFDADVVVVVVVVVVEVVVCLEASLLSLLADLHVVFAYPTRSGGEIDASALAGMRSFMCDGRGQLPP